MLKKQQQNQKIKNKITLKHDLNEQILQNQQRKDLKNSKQEILINLSLIKDNILYWSILFLHYATFHRKQVHTY